MSKKRTPLQELKPHHRIAVGMKLTGTKHADIAESLNTSKSVVDRWMADPLVREEIERQTESAVTTLHEKIASGVAVAVDVLKQMALAPGLDQQLSSDARLNALDKLTRMSPETHPEAHTPQSSALPGGNTTVLNVLGQMDEAQQAQVARNAARKLLEVEEAAKRGEIPSGPTVEGNGKPKESE